MSIHAEWVGVTDCPINFVPAGFNVDDGDTCESCGGTGRIFDEHGVYVKPCEEWHDDERTTEGPSLILGSDDSVFVVQAGRKDQLVEFARTLLRMAEDS